MIPDNKKICPRCGSILAETSPSFGDNNIPYKLIYCPVCLFEKIVYGRIEWEE
jgi:ribosomal protein S27E